MRIKGHYNAHKLWPLSATIFMLSILPKLEGEDGNEALRHSSDRARHAAHVASFNFHLTPVQTLREHIFVQVIAVSLIHRVYYVSGEISFRRNACICIFSISI